MKTTVAKILRELSLVMRANNPNRFFYENKRIVRIVEHLLLILDENQSEIKTESKRNAAERLENSPQNFCSFYYFICVSLKRKKF